MRHVCRLLTPAETAIGGVQSNSCSGRRTDCPTRDKTLESLSSRKAGPTAQSRYIQIQHTHVSYSKHKTNGCVIRFVASYARVIT